MACRGRALNRRGRRRGQPRQVRLNGVGYPAKRRLAPSQELSPLSWRQTASRRLGARPVKPMNDHPEEEEEEVGRQPGDEMLEDIPDAEDLFEPQPPFEPADEKLRWEDRERQMEWMREWFFDRYCDPAMETPYDSGEGGYLWLWGGPYDAEEELQGRFSEIVEDDVIEELVIELTSDGNFEWAPVRRYDERDYEDQFALDIDLDQPHGPLWKLKGRLHDATSVLSLEASGSVMEQLARMAFGAAISALEAYLWETVAFWVKGDRDVLKGIVKHMPELRDVPIKLGNVFDEHDGIEARVMLYLQNVVWHRFDTVSMLLKFGFGIKVPSFKPFVQALAKRHHIVHRSGHDMDGDPVTVTIEDAKELAAAVETFASAVYAAILDKLLPEDRDGVGDSV